VYLNGVIAQIISDTEVSVDGILMSQADFIRFAYRKRMEPYMNVSLPRPESGKGHKVQGTIKKILKSSVAKPPPPKVSLSYRSLLLVDGCVATQADLKAYLKDEYSKGFPKKFVLWRSYPQITAVFEALIDSRLPSNRSERFLNTIEDCVMEIEDEFPRDSCLAVEEVWKGVKAKARSFLETPEMKALIEEELAQHKKQKTEEE
jgi:hypothetical protein